MAQLYFYYSAMNAGKSTTLLQSAFNYKERGMNPMILTAEIDNRYGEAQVSSRIGISAKAHVFNQATSILDLVATEHQQNKIDCVLIDEAQFLTKQHVEQVCTLVDELKIPVLCYGLRTDFRGELFQGAQYLLAWADKLIELKTVCHCGRKANMVLRLDAEHKAVKDGEQVEIGGNDRYESVCRKHYNQAFS